MSVLTPAPAALCEVGAPPTSPPLPVALPVGEALAEVCRGVGWSQRHPAAPATESQKHANTDHQERKRVNPAAQRLY